jgi:GntR family transcriptional regulator
VDLTIDLKDGVPIYRQIANQIRYMVASGLLRPDEELPAIRVLAAQLRVTPNTVVKAYEELEGTGVISKRRGSGCFVSDGPSRLAEREKRRILEQRIDGLLAEARQLNYTTSDLLKLIHKRLVVLDTLTGKAANGVHP